MDKNLYGYLVDLDRILWTDISAEDRRRELDHFLFSVEKVLRAKRTLTLDENKKIFHAARTLIDSEFKNEITRAVILEALAIRRMTKNPLVKRERLRSLSDMLLDSVRTIELLPPDKWSVRALIDAGKAFERISYQIEMERNLKRAGKSYTIALKLIEQYMYDDDPSIIRKRIQRIKKLLAK